MMSGTDCPAGVVLCTIPLNNCKPPYRPSPKNTNPPNKAGVTGGIACLRQAGPLAGFTSVDHKRYSMAQPDPSEV
jgi:hypothetical protein